MGIVLLLLPIVSIALILFACFTRTKSTKHWLLSFGLVGIFVTSFLLFILPNLTN
ncbi:hypothetical protein [Alkalihalobacillus pseudalcaliphilus]|uniref:hypothetical protein n=1 Tax=Alkalihalobacillus pseudalcaliphilus TaxID=79884 RepID=UPI000A4FEDFE|nr:hypothetical protein [Alkalihalobacillus pseudalcaliphilus]